jgi:hypothetical protein
MRTEAREPVTFLAASARRIRKEEGRNERTSGSDLQRLTKPRAECSRDMVVEVRYIKGPGIFMRRKWFGVVRTETNTIL